MELDIKEKTSNNFWNKKAYSTLSLSLHLETNKRILVNQNKHKMPIYCNDREIILKSNPELDDPVEAFYRKHKEKIQKLTDYVVIKKYESQSKFLYDDLGRPLRPTINTVPWNQYIGETGTGNMDIREYT